MAYRCQGCGEAQEAGTRCYITPVAFRSRTYSFTDKKTKRQRTTQGQEIVVEAKLCFACHTKVAADIAKEK